MADMNMVPFIDISLVLLIIFMVMTPFLVQNEVRVNLPRAVTGIESPDDPLVVVVREGGFISMGGRAVRTEDLRELFKNEISQRAQRPVLIQSDKQVPLQTVVQIMDAAKVAGVAKLGIAVTHNAR